MTITQLTSFPISLNLPGGNQITATGTTGSELKASLVSQLQAKIVQQQQGAQAAQSAIDAVNG